VVGNCRYPRSAVRLIQVRKPTKNIGHENACSPTVDSHGHESIFPSPETRHTCVHADRRSFFWMAADTEDDAIHLWGEQTLNPKL
jgi:hypothetical protein